MGPDKLFELNKIKFGITPGCRVAHILADGKGTELVFDGSVDYSSGYAEINPAENYINEGDKLNKDNFIELAEMAEELYQKNKDDKYVANMLFAVKDYLTASSHEAQHNALKMIQLRALEAHEKFEKDIAKYQNKEKYAGKLDYAKKHGAAVDSIAAHMTQLLQGGLKLSQKEQPQVTKDPANTFMGYSIPGKILGNWQPSVKELFPHNPSPNDIKQGVGLMDCFMMAQLCNIARQKPDKIKKAMCDNGDGTVTVRFYNKTKNNLGITEYQPEYIRVNKTVNQDLFGNNYYASSSLWVQMMEKAFAEYAKRHLLDSDVKKRDSGMGAINRGRSREFLEAFTGEPIVDIQNDFGVINSTFADKSDDGSWKRRPEYYLPEEEQLYDFFKTCVNDEHYSLTCGTDSRHDFNAQEIKDLGIRTGHAYSITKLFKKTVNGKEKLFVQVRDPYATFTPNYDETGKLLPQSDTQTLGNMIDGAMNVGRENMGAFNLELRDFLYFFGTVDGFSPEKATQFKAMTAGFRKYDYVKMTDDEIKDKKIFEANYDARCQAKEIYNAMIKEFHDALTRQHNILTSINAKKGVNGPDNKFGDRIKELEDGLKEVQNKLSELSIKYGKTNPHLFKGEVLFGELTKKELKAQKEAENPEYQRKAKEVANEFTFVDIGEDGEAIEQQLQQVQPEQVQPAVDPDIAKEWVIDPIERDNAQKELIMSNLKGDNFETFATSIDTVYKNLNMTSRYFSWMNSDEYNKMFSKLESVNKKVQAIANDFAGEPDENQAEELAEDIMQLSSLNDKYIDHKFSEINKNLAKGKTSNERSFFRMSGALSLSNLFSGAKPMTPILNHSMAAMDIMMKDIKTHILLLEKNENVLGPSLEESKKVEKGMEDFLRKNPKVNDKLEAYRKSKMQTKEQEISNNDFEIVEDAIDIDGKENVKAPEKGLGM